MLRTAADSVLACPDCKGMLDVDAERRAVRCSQCRRDYPVQDGIPILLTGRETAQKEELAWRNAVATPYMDSSLDALLELIGEHHCVPVMRQHAETFKRRFAPHDWILDIGVGLGWHWSADHAGACVLGIDASIGNLLLARRFLGPDHRRVSLVCADAAALPVRDRSIAGVWSVQAFQHFPADVLSSVLRELHRVLQERFAMEIYNLHPALFLRAVYRLFGRRLHCHGATTYMELNRLSPKKWRGIWKQLRGGQPRMSHGYSELFFHPDLRCRPRPYPERLETALAAYAPLLAGLFARQGRISIEMWA
jgi:uncharacterized protein YbaR (Trm112 family)